MSSSRKKSSKDSDFIAPDGTGGYSSDSAADDPESDLESDDSADAGPSTSRPKRSTRKPSPSKRASRAARDKQQKSGHKVVGGSKGKGKGKAWEGSFEHTWDTVREDELGSLEGAVSELLLNSRTKRVMRDTTSIQRGIIRHVYLVIDLSLTMLVREFKETWLDLTLKYAREFVNEFFDQNPISQMAILVTRDGAAERLSPLSGNSVDHLKALQNKKKLDPRGEPSLQNVLEMARAGLSHLPPHGSREIIIMLASLTTCDPGNIHTTINATEKDRIRVNIIGTSAEMRICKDICTQTKGTYTVAKDELSLRELLFEFVSPPPTLAPSKSHVLGGPSASAPTNAADLMLMGFPTLVHSPYPGLCSCHSKLKNVGYTCPRCRSRICDVPTECRVCGLTVVSSPHLARSYRHLFPVENYDQVNGPSDTPFPPSCYSCTFPFKSSAHALQGPAPTATSSSLSPTGRYACRACRNHFCLDCDVLVHTALGFCPGCV